MSFLFPDINCWGIKKSITDMNNYNENPRIDSAIDKILTERIINPQQIVGNKRYAIWLYSKERRQYEWLNHYPTEQLARDAITRVNLELSDVDLRLEEYFNLEECWKCSLHIKD